MDRIEGFHEPRDLPIKAGEVVTIRKGTLIHTTQPGQVTRRAGRTFKVTVDHVLPGCTWRDWSGVEDLAKRQNPSIRWPGSGGYWQAVDINDVLEGR